MGIFNIIMPKLGESVQEAVITKWFVKTGDLVHEDDTLFDIATEKVDSEIPSPVEGIIKEIYFKENDTVAVGTVVAVIQTDVENTSGTISQPEEKINAESSSDILSDKKEPSRFYSPLVKTIAEEKSILPEELDGIEGSGLGGRVRKEDVLKYIENKAGHRSPSAMDRSSPVSLKIKPGADDEIIEMDRMRKLIAEHMVLSKNIAPHVTNFIEADVTELALWRDKNKNIFEERNKVKLSFMPFFVNAVALSLNEYPLINSSVDGTKIIIHKNINIGVAVALPSGNLIVPVVKNADRLNIPGLAIAINTLAEKARNNKLSPDEVTGGTFTITNFGTFKNLTGTPIINQPESAILATGIIKKVPAVLETPSGDVIAIRHHMILSLSYDHRNIDGALAGAFLKRIAERLEKFDTGNIF